MQARSKFQRAANSRNNLYISMNITRIPLTDFATGNQVDLASIENKTPVVRSFNYFGEKPVEEEKEYTKTQHLEEIKKAEEKAFEEGYQKGKSEMDTYISTEDIKIKEQISGMMSRFSESFGTFKKQIDEFRIETAKIAAYAVKKIFADKVNEKIGEIILDALSKSSDLIKKEPTLKIKATKKVIDNTKGSIEEFFKTQGLNIKLTYEEAQDANDASILIEWEDSGIKIDLNERMQETDKILAEFIKSL